MDCMICLENLNQDIEISFCCKQKYHYNCIHKWVKTHNSCPICRKILDKKVTNIFRTIETTNRQIEIKECCIENILDEIETINNTKQHHLRKLEEIQTFTATENIENQQHIVFNIPPSRLFQRRNAISLLEQCLYPAFCRCFACSCNFYPRWN